MEIKVFIASSLALTEEREAIVRAVEKMNDGINSRLGRTFTSYEFCRDAIQDCTIESSQSIIDEEIDKALAFVLIVDGEIGKATIHEYELARKHFINNRFPRFIMIFFRQKEFSSLQQRLDMLSEENLKSYKKIKQYVEEREITAGRKKWEEFAAEKFGTTGYDDTGSLVSMDHIYAAPYESPQKLEEKFSRDFSTWVDSPYAPLLNAKTGANFTPSDIYAEGSERLKKCSDEFYYKRPFDNKLFDTVNNDLSTNFHVITGESLSGKTRAMYNLIKNMPEKWFYKIDNIQTTINLKKNIEDLFNYVKTSTGSKRNLSLQDIYFLFDDFDVFVSQDDEDSKTIYKVLTYFIKIIATNSKFHVIMTSSSGQWKEATYFFNLHNVCPKEIFIPPMRKDETLRAIHFFKNKYQINEENKYYATTGALLIDLNNVKEHYQYMLRNSQLPYAKEVFRALKAFSVWHNTNKGNVHHIYDFCCKLTDNQISETQFLKIISELISTKMTGISMLREDEEKPGYPDRIYVQEYIYKVILNYNGTVIPDVPARENQIAKEKELAYTILYHYPKVENAAKLIKRMDHPEVGRHIYNLITEKEPVETCLPVRWTDAYDWVSLIREELSSCAETDIEEPEFEPRNFSPNFYNTRLNLCENLEEALSIYNMDIPASCKNNWQINALLFKSKTDEDLGLIKALPEFDDTDDFIKPKLIDLSKDFDEAVSLFLSIERPTKFTELWEVEDEKSFPYRQKRNNILKSFSSLFKLVKHTQDYKKLMELFRSYFVYFLDDPEEFDRFWSCCEPYADTSSFNNLDLLTRVMPFSINKLAESIFSDSKYDVHNYIQFYKELVENELEHSLDNKYTDNDRLRIVITFISNGFMMNCKDYDDGKKIFDIMRYRDSYTYSCLFSKDGCDYLTAFNIFTQYAEPSVAKGNLRITIPLLNSMLFLATDQREIDKINKLFDKYGLAKDNITINNFLKNWSYEHSISYLMKGADTFDFDVITLGHLLSKSPDLEHALGYFTPLPASYTQKLPPEFKMVKEDLYYQKIGRKKRLCYQEMVASNHYSWTVLFKKNCTMPHHIEVLNVYLDYLENENQLMELTLSEKAVTIKEDSGKIYNICLDNKSFVGDYDNAWKFIDKHQVQIDAFTISSLIKLLLDEYKKAESEYWENKTIERLKQLFVENRDIIVCNGNMYYNQRFKFFSSFSELQDCVIFPLQDKYQQTIFKRFNAVQYFQKLAVVGIPVDPITIAELFTIEQGFTDEILKELVPFIIRERVKIDTKNIRNIRKLVNKNRLDKFLLRKLEEYFLEINPKQANKWIVGELTQRRMNPEEAIQMINHSNAISALFVLNTCIGYYDIYAHYQNNKTAMQMSLAIYNEQIKGVYQPNEETFSSLASNVKTPDDVDIVMKTFRDAKLSFPPSIQMLTSIIRVCENLNDVIKRVQAHLKLGGNVTSHHINALLRKYVELGNNLQNREAYNKIRDIVNHITCDDLKLDDVVEIEYIRKKNETEEDISRNINFKLSFDTCNDLFKLIDIDKLKLLKTIIRTNPDYLTMNDSIIGRFFKDKRPVEEFSPYFEALKDVPIAMCHLLKKIIEKMLDSESADLYAGTKKHNYEQILHYWIIVARRIDTQVIIHQMIQFLLKQGYEWERIKQDVMYGIWHNQLEIQHFLTQDMKSTPVKIPLEYVYSVNSSLDNELVKGIIKLEKIDDHTRLRVMLKCLREFDNRGVKLHRKTIQFISQNCICKSIEALLLIPYAKKNIDALTQVFRETASRICKTEELQELFFEMAKYHMGLSTHIVTAIINVLQENRFHNHDMEVIYNQVTRGIKNGNLSYKDFTLPWFHIEKNERAEVQQYTINAIHLGESIEKAETLEKAHVAIEEYITDSLKIGSAEIYFPSFLSHLLLELCIRIANEKENKRVYNADEEDNRIENGEKEIILAIYSRISNMQPFPYEPLYSASLKDKLGSVAKSHHVNMAVLQQLEMSPVDLFRQYMNHANKTILTRWLQALPVKKDLIRICDLVVSDKDFDYTSFAIIIRVIAEQVTGSANYTYVLKQIIAYPIIFKNRDIMTSLIISMVRTAQRRYERGYFFIPILKQLKKKDDDTERLISFSDFLPVDSRLENDIKSTFQLSGNCSESIKKLFDGLELVKNIHKAFSPQYALYSIRLHLNYYKKINDSMIIAELIRLYIKDQQLDPVREVYKSLISGRWNISPLLGSNISSNECLVVPDEVIYHSLLLLPGIDSLLLLDEFFRRMGSDISENSIEKAVSCLNTIKEYKTFYQLLHTRKIPFTPAIANRLLWIMKKYKDADDIAKQCYCRIVTAAETNSLNHRDFLYGQSILEEETDTWLIRRVTLGEKDMNFIRTRLLKVKLLEIYKHPKSYYKALQIVRLYLKDNPNKELPESVLNKLNTFCYYFLQGIERDQYDMYEIQSVLWLCSECNQNLKGIIQGKYPNQKYSFVTVYIRFLLRLDVSTEASNAQNIARITLGKLKNRLDKVKGGQRPGFYLGMLIFSKDRQQIKNNFWLFMNKNDIELLFDLQIDVKA